MICQNVRRSLTAQLILNCLCKCVSDGRNKQDHLKMKYLSLPLTHTYTHFYFPQGNQEADVGSRQQKDDLHVQTQGKTWKNVKQRFTPSSGRGHSTVTQWIQDLFITCTKCALE